MKHSRDCLTKSLKVAETNAERHSIEETLGRLHVKRNEYGYLGYMIRSVSLLQI